MHILWYFIDRKNAHYNGYIVVPNNNSLGEKKNSLENFEFLYTKSVTTIINLVKH